MKFWTHYHTPQTVDEALALLTQYAGQARVIAGGTDLLVDARAEGEAAAEALVDVTSIADLREITEVDGRIVIGAGVTHSQIVKSALLQEGATCLVESCGVVGGPQVRNVGTLGGNVAHALPAGDGTVSLVALDAEVEIVKDGVRRWAPIREMYLGPGKSLLDSTRDLLLRFRFRPHGTAEATAFSRIMRPQGVALPILGCAVWLRLDASTRSTIVESRVCIAPISPTPNRASEVEAALVGKPANQETIERVAEFAMGALHPRTSKYRATAEYRQEMIAVLLKRTLTAAVERASGN
ncbi:MAG: FAD binding domain-containing protein [Chloroflexi bacterium]|nr:FAD binding domain-containing protein [Chloroflexota bacterium]